MKSARNDIDSSSETPSLIEFRDSTSTKNTGKTFRARNSV